jgi:hypothetical protein
MRWATFQIPPAATERIGVVRGNEIYTVAAGPRLIDLLGDDGERLAAAGAKTLASPAEIVRVDRVRLLPPIPRPPAVRDFMTFRQHIEVIRKAQGLELPKQFFEMPVFYFTNPHALVGAHDPVPMPPGCQNLDFECEIGVVIGRAGENLDPKNAADHVVGYCLFNDWSARDVQRNEMEMRLGPAKGKAVARDEGRARAVAAPDGLRSPDGRLGQRPRVRPRPLVQRLLVDRRDHRVRVSRDEGERRGRAGDGHLWQRLSGRAADA